MVIIDPSEEPNSPDERSPLKTGQLNPTTQAAAGAPPPPYDAAASREPHQYQSVTVVQHSYVPEPVAHPRTEGPLKRFIRAFAVALIVLFLWGMFLDSLDMLTGNKGGKRRGGRTYEERITLEWLIHDWYKASPTKHTPCPCQDDNMYGTPGRVLPIQYPPVLPQVTETTSIPKLCATRRSKPTTSTS